MPKLFEDLRERLLLAGIAPRHVRRYLAELSDHLADLRAEADDEAAALVRLGTLEDLAKPMLAQPELRCWIGRAPWAAMVLGPFLMMIGSAVALFAVIAAIAGIWFLISPWHDIEPMGLQMLAKAMLAGLVAVAPVLIGWAMCALAAQRRLAPVWPLIGLAAFAILSGTFDAAVTFPTVSGEHGELRLGFGWPYFGWPYLDPADRMDVSPVRWIANLILIIGPYVYWLKQGGGRKTARF